MAPWLLADLNILFSRFVAWMNTPTVFQTKVHNKYSSEDFKEDLRQVLRRSRCKDEKKCFIFDKYSGEDSGFLERMLANGGQGHGTGTPPCSRRAPRGRA